MKVFASLAILMILLFTYAYFNTTILAITMYPGIHQTKRYYAQSEYFTSLRPTSLEFPWSM